MKEVKLGEVITLGNGKSRSKEIGQIPIYGGNGILGYSNQSNCKGQTIIVGRVGAYCGSVYFENRPIWVSDNALSVVAKEGTDIVFLYYFLKNLNLNEYAEGSSHPLLTQSLLKSIDVKILAREIEQKAIAKVLSSLDDKIELLNEQNKTLEQMAETLFRQWFVEEAEEDWEELRLDRISNISIGRTPPRKESEWFSFNETDVKWISIKDMGCSSSYIASTSEYLTKEAIEKFRVPMIPANTVLLSFKMTVGRVKITTEPMVSNEAIAQFQLNGNSIVSVEYLYLFLKSFKYDSLGSTSSIVTAINSAMIKAMMIPIPNTEKLSKFNTKISKIFQKIKSNQSQIQTLTSLRDTLLHKLMSGEVRVDMN